MVARAVALALVASLALVATASATPHERRVTLIKRYTVANDGVVIASASEGVNPIGFSPPSWTQSAYVTVRDETPGPQEAVFFSVSWGPDSSIECSHQADTLPSDSSLRVVRLRARRGTLLVQPLVGKPFQDCPVSFVSVPTSGTITVTFSSRRSLPTPP